MPSILEGYNYDIFVSYRQKDNKGDRWVSEFVEALKTELESTFKEEISVYFDINPHDGLLETHDVDASLKDKLKCLLFIPVISRTYCDPKSFAWEHEFKAFVVQASKDQFGLKVRLPNGNVANRVLPIRIHDLDADDIKLCESVLEGILRGVEFIYKEPGVNKPLTFDDDEKKNLNNTKYKIQINKVGNAIKEIISALKSDSEIKLSRESKMPSEKIRTRESLKGKVRKGIINKRSNKWLIVLLSLIILIIGVIATLKIIAFNKRSIDIANLEKSIAVLPFRNLSNDSSQSYFCDGFQEEIMNNLQRIKDFKVRSRTSTEQYRKTAKTIKKIGEELNVNYLIEGSVGREDNYIRIWIQLISAKTDNHVWANEYTSEMKEIFSLQSEISKDIAARLKTILSPQEIIQINSKPTENIDAYNLYLKGRYFWNKRTKIDLRKSISYFEEAIKIDTTFSLAYSGIADSYIVLGEWSYYPPDEVFPKAEKAAMKAIELDNELAEAHTALAAFKRDYKWDWKEAEKEYLKAIELKPNYPTAYQWYSEYLSIVGRDDEAIKNLTHAQELDPLSPILFTIGGRITYPYARQFNIAILQCQKALEIDSNYVLAHYALANNYLNMGRVEEAIAQIKVQLAADPDSAEKALLGIAYALSGKQNEAELILNELINDSDKMYIPRTSMARLYSVLGRKGKALDLLEEAYLNKDYGLIHIYKSPDFAKLRNETRFTHIIKKMGFKVF